MKRVLTMGNLLLCIGGASFFALFGGVYALAAIGYPTQARLPEGTVFALYMAPLLTVAGLGLRAYAARRLEQARKEVTIAALDALESMDDFARMANITPTGPYNVLKAFIDNA